MLRRPRFKPTANLTTRRAVPITVTTMPNDDTTKQSDEIICSTIKTTSNKEEDKLVVTNNDKPTENGIGRRRLVKPTVNIPAKRSKPVPEKEKKINVNDEICENSFEPEQVGKTPTEDVDVSKLITNNITVNNKAVVNSTIDETCFKSPLALASHNLQSPNASRFTNKIFEQSVIMSPNHQLHSPATNGFDGIEPITRKEQQENFEEMLRGPMSPTKIRQRIRPTPCFGHRRNSIQGNSSEPEDEHNKRQRHYSTSSTYSNTSVNLNIYPSNININNNTNNTVNNNQQIKLINGTINGMIKQANRIRTESSCSNISDMSLTRDIMTKSRNFRSEECQRMAEAKRDFRNRFIGDNKPDKSRLTMYDMIYYNPVSNPMKSSGTNSVCGSIVGGSTSNHNIKERRLSSASSTANSFISKKSMVSIKQEENSMPVPQLKLGPNGEMVLDEKSLIIETTLDKEARDKLANADIIYDDEFSGNSGFYKRQRRSREWSAAETIKFYRCLHTIGTDFSLMITLFPKRTRRDLKLKFKKEERTNLQLVNKALMHPKHFNIEDLKLEFDREEEEYDRNQIIEKEMKKKQISLKRIEIEKLKSKLPGRLLSKAMRIMTGGDVAYEMENISMRKRHAINTKKLIPDQEINISCNDYVEKLPSFNNVKQFQMVSQQMSVPVADIEMNNNNEINDSSATDSLTNVLNNDYNTTNVRADITLNNNLNKDIITKEDILNMEIIFDDTAIVNNYLNNNNTNDIDNNNILIGNCNTECYNNEINKSNEIVISTGNVDATENTSNDDTSTKVSNRKIKRKPTINLLPRSKRSKLVPITEDEKGKSETTNLRNDSQKLETRQKANIEQNTAIDENIVNSNLLDSKVDEIEKQLQLFENDITIPDNEVYKNNIKIDLESCEINLNKNKDYINTDSNDNGDKDIEIIINNAETLINKSVKQSFTINNEQEKINENQKFTSETQLSEINLEKQVPLVTNAEKTNPCNIKDKIIHIEDAKIENKLIIDNTNEIIDLSTVENMVVMLHGKHVESDSSEINVEKKNDENQKSTTETQLIEISLEKQVPLVNNTEKTNPCNVRDKIIDTEDVKIENKLLMDGTIDMATIENKVVMVHEKHVESDSSETNLIKIEESKFNATNGEITLNIDNNNEDDDNEDNELVMIESIDPNNVDNKLFEVYQINRKTGKLDEKPLDLPKEIMDKIKQC